MSDTPYRKLQEHLDSLPVGFPKTDSGIEIKILKKIFTPEEAEMAVKLTMIPETVEDFSKRTGMDSSEAGEKLEAMAKKGQIFRMKRKENLYYSAAVFVPGIWEYQLKNLDRELAELFEEFYEDAFEGALKQGNTPLFRILPIDENISPEMEVMPYHQVKDLIRSQRTIALAECICRKEKRLLGEGCDHLLEVCLLFSHMARFYVENGLARFITVEEALEVLDKAEEDGLVHSPVNTQHIMGLCNCCGCCCGLLRGITQLNMHPSILARSDFYCVSDSELCTGCGDCLERCPVTAITVDDVAVVDRERCIGCGLCVSTCPTEAMSLVAKSEGVTTPPPSTSGDMLMRLAEERSKGGN
jgi:electron transport complex protein RnfB